MEKLTFKEYQEKTKETAIYHDSVHKLTEPLECLIRVTGTYGLKVDLEKVEALLNLSYIGLGLGEVGEIQGKIKKIIRDSGGIITVEHKKAIGKELGDLLWYVSQTCNELEISLEEIAEGNLEKLAGRKERGVLGGSGDER